jgi:hypothetical protein
MYLTAKHDAFNAPVGSALNNEEELRGEIFLDAFSECNSFWFYQKLNSN